MAVARQDKERESLPTPPESAPPSRPSSPDSIRPMVTKVVGQDEQPLRLIQQRNEEPSEQTPLVYRERAYFLHRRVADGELARLLAVRLRQAVDSLLERDEAKFVQLAVFDHDYSDRPKAPPIATLAWRSWRGEAVLQIRGQQLSIPAPPPATPSAPPPAVQPAGAAAAESTAKGPPPAQNAAPAASSTQSATVEPKAVEHKESEPPPAELHPAPQYVAAAPLKPRYAATAPTPSIVVQDEAAGSDVPAEEKEAKPPEPATQPRSLPKRDSKQDEASDDGWDVEESAKQPSSKAAAGKAEASSASKSEAAKPMRAREDTVPDAPKTKPSDAQAEKKKEPAKSPESDADAKPPKSDRRRSAPPKERRRAAADDDLIVELFEQMHDLHFMPDIPAGADYVLDVIWYALPCAAILVHVFDIDRRQFVVVRARGGKDREVLLQQTPDTHPLFVEALKRTTALTLEGDERLQDPRYEKFGVSVSGGVCGPVQQAGRYLGAIEVLNPMGDTPFQANEVNALDYICAQFAGFLAERPIVLEEDTVLPKGDTN